MYPITISFSHEAQILQLQIHIFLQPSSIQYSFKVCKCVSSVGHGVWGVGQLRPFVFPNPPGFDPLTALMEILICIVVQLGYNCLIAVTVAWLVS